MVIFSSQIPAFHFFEWKFVSLTDRWVRFFFLGTRLYLYHKAVILPVEAPDKSRWIFPTSNDFIRLPKGKADKIIACGVNLQKILDNMAHTLFFTFRENLFL